MEHSIYMNGIKSILKSSGLKYSDIADKLNMSESGVKKMLNSKDISFRRILQLCEVIGVKPSQVLNFSENNEKPILKLNNKQESILVNNRQAFIVFWRFSVEKLSPHEISNKEKITLTEVLVILDKLYQLELVEKRKNNFYGKHNGLFKLDDNSKLARKLNKDWSELTLRRSLNTRSDYSKYHRLLTLKTSEEGYNQLINKIQNFLKSVVNDTEQILISKKNEKLKDFSLVIASAKHGVLDPD